MPEWTTFGLLTNELCALLGGTASAASGSGKD